ncbi:hypothetical protein QQS21_012270 [Conoideocrella luteorostrata]|uniref:PH domain-containing protein n=1 Tax=Conoideocrella luteorostrata TaxID=1105319 RepID=A0AAJ0FSL3_9HYPO|nr:hypothetical protein QQS21_012270 [Conoideocrella luteorostrata]
MDGLDGFLQVPPDRSQILGRQSWKTRYITVGSPQGVGRDRQGSTTLSTHAPGAPGRVTSVLQKPLNRATTSEQCLSVFKTKEDGEPIQRWSLSHISDCQVKLVSHRKQGHVLPTLVITVSDNQRKRRSSRATGFVSANKDSGVTTLWFRTPPDNHRPSLYEWARFIMAKKGLSSAAESPVSPVFTSPFQTRSNDSQDYHPRPGSGNRALQHKSSTATYSTGPLDHATTFSSVSPSLRSKRSDISSPSSNIHPTQKVQYAMPEQHYTSIRPGDIVTSAPNGEYQGQFIEGWTSAQGRSSTMSSPVRSRDSIGSQGQQPSIVDVSSPPAPGETILDRAFQLGHVPGAGSYVPGQEKLTSIARFDALMRKADDRRRKRETIQRDQQGTVKSAFDEDDSSDDVDGQESDTSDADSDERSQEHDQRDRYSPHLMSPSAQRALAFIIGRQESDRSSKSHRPAISRTHLSFHAGTVPASTQSPPSRPHTAHAKSRPNTSRTQSTPHLIPTATTTLDLPSSGKPHDEGHHRSTAVPEKRHSNSSAKRLSFTEFTKRLSSTSSLLLVQTNASGGSSEPDVHHSSPAPRTNLSLRGSGAPPRPRDRDDQDRRCGWRGSVGVVGTEGGFL